LNIHDIFTMPLLMLQNVLFEMLSTWPLNRLKLILPGLATHKNENICVCVCVLIITKIHIAHIFI